MLVSQPSRSKEFISENTFKRRSTNEGAPAFCFRFVLAHEQYKPELCIKDNSGFLRLWLKRSDFHLAAKKIPANCCDNKLSK
ncbi:hypothetical protein [Rugamonas aquatica]|uniref:Uncharacterized protein n=1 Tax=Rugamonas aquatica TaxID=2743357 RepID=A0A6A7N926_9BURK|nr:hypothetical protein [Rugamonas aquatica]MQA41595.1 hypothetical protein [Rugamonas aquatica]